MSEGDTEIEEQKETCTHTHTHTYTYTHTRTHVPADKSRSSREASRALSDEYGAGVDAGIVELVLVEAVLSALSADLPSGVASASLSFSLSSSSDRGQLSVYISLHCFSVDTSGNPLLPACESADVDTFIRRDTTWLVYIKGN